jgi:predicted house-cleaning noncanonical NTP pyrophosphatase (MazG superfamily)
MQKLVRDKIPEIIKSNGQNPVTRILEIGEYKTELAKKLVEEALEFQQDLNIEELADVMEVFEAIMKTYGFTLAELTKARDKKNAERGKFDKKIFLVDTLDM